MKNNRKPEKQAQPASLKPRSFYTDTLTIDREAAVFFQPDSFQLENIKMNTREQVFMGSMHEYDYLLRNAHNVIKKQFPSLKIIEQKNTRYLRFLSTGTKEVFVDLDTVKDPYGLYLFRPKVVPLLTDLANIDTDLGFYFSLKKPTH